MRLITSIRAMRSWSEDQWRRKKSIALVPTMGALHEAHLRLVREGRKRADRVVVSIFVNPAQFAPGEDFAAYPRNFARDRKLLEAEGVDVVFHPSVAAMYPEGYQTHIDVARLSSYLCGLSRPGHFRGVCTVVAKLFHVVRPQFAVFGRKDYQQLQIVRRMVADLDFGIKIVSHPIVRERDGLALSSRNAYLGSEERKAALSLSRSLKMAAALARNGETRRAPFIETVQAEIARAPLARLDYVSLCHPVSLEEVETVRDGAVLALAVRIGKARLIDNAVIRA